VDDVSTYLKGKQIVAIQEGVKNCPQQSANRFQRNLALAAMTSLENLIDPKLLYSVQHCVEVVREQLTLQKFAGFAINQQLRW
jgi:hypothetical protein